MEPKAKEKYKSLTLSEVIESGLVVKTGQPWLCATPDGIVKDKNGDICILEIKCPSSCLDKNINVPYIVNNELKKSHQYYTQVQLQMYCCNLKKAHFFVYSNCDHKLLTVERDEAFL
jgi:putative phage-type endonuclease